MLCSLRKWRISKTLDSGGKPLSPALKHHISTCRQCREYFRLGEVLEHMTPDAFAASSEADLSQLPQQIIANLKTSPNPENHLRKRPFLIPLLSSAAALTVCVLVLVFLLPSSSADLRSLNPLSQWDAAQSAVSSFWEDVQDPYQKEWKNLKHSFGAAADFFINFVDLPEGSEE